MAFVAEVPDELETVTWTTPVPPGEVAVMDVPLALTVTDVAGVLPKLTLEPCVNPDPEIVTTVPPLPGPELGDTPVTC